MALEMRALSVAALLMGCFLLVAEARPGRGLLQESFCPDPSAPNQCYNAQGDAYTCCAGSCTGNPSSVPACEASEGGPDSNAHTEPTSNARPESSSSAGPVPTPVSNNRPAGSRTITLHNNCSETVWIASFTTPGHTPLAVPSDPTLSPGQSFSYYPDNNWIGRIWGRTKCGGDPFRCATGDCNGLNCAPDVTGAPPATLAEFAMTQWAGLDFYDVSLVDGYNLPMQIAPSVSSCIVAGCNSDLVKDGTCPPELQQKDSTGQVVGCWSACSAPHLQSSPDLPKFCCTGAYAEAEACIAVHPDAYTTALKNGCPLAYSYAYDDANKSVFGCPNVDYDIYFCGGPGLTQL